MNKRGEAMRMKSLKILLILTIVVVSCLVTLIFIISFDDKREAKQSSVQEPTVTLNDVISRAITVYTSSPYRRYSKEELQKYFVRDIADKILKSYEPFDDPYEEKVIEFEEQPFPEIKDITIQFDSGEYAVKLLFGEVYYNYRLTIAPNRIITKITDGGISFD